MSKYYDLLAWFKVGEFIFSGVILVVACIAWLILKIKIHFNKGKGDK